MLRLIASIVAILIFFGSAGLFIYASLVYPMPTILNELFMVAGITALITAVAGARLTFARERSRSLALARLKEMT